jgi:hypothetical protein
VKFTPAAGFTANGPGSTHGGIGMVLTSMFKSSAHIRWSGVTMYELAATGVPAFQYSNNNFNIDSGNISWADPTHDMLSTARELMFRTAQRAANVTNPADIHKVEAKVDRIATVYKSHYLFLGLALLFTVVSAISIVPILLGFWNLGRYVTLSPIEIAKAFNAPILGSSDSNMPVNDLLKEAGKREVRYGAVSLAPNSTMAGNFNGGGPEKLIMYDPGSIKAPQEGNLFVG